MPAPSSRKPPADSLSTFHKLMTVDLFEACEANLSFLVHRCICTWQRALASPHSLPLDPRLTRAGEGEGPRAQACPDLLQKQHLGLSFSWDQLPRLLDLAVLILRTSHMEITGRKKDECLLSVLQVCLLGHRLLWSKCAENRWVAAQMLIN